MTTSCDSIGLACCQFRLRPGGKAANFERAASLAASASLPPGTWLVLPEMFATGFGADGPDVAEGPGGPTSRFLADLARRHGFFVQGGCLSNGREGLPRNEVLVFAPDGRRVGRYAKRRLFSPDGEHRRCRPGRRAAVFLCLGARFAPAICYDIRFPELFRQCRPGVAEVLSVSAAWPASREEAWVTLLRARAIENQAFVVAANALGAAPGGREYPGRSLVIDPEGRILADAGRREGVAAAVADMDGLRKYRATFPALRDSRNQGGNPRLGA